jgi:hypothetical protein
MPVSRETDMKDPRWVRPQITILDNSTVISSLQALEAKVEYLAAQIQIKGGKHHNILHPQHFTDSHQSCRQPSPGYWPGRGSGKSAAVCREGRERMVGLVATLAELTNQHGSDEMAASIVGARRCV